MAGAYRRGQQFHGLLRKLLASRNALRRSQRAGGPLVVLALFTVELGPLSLVTGLE
jgi:hypothetical protein